MVRLTFEQYNRNLDEEETKKKKIVPVFAQSRWSFLLEMIKVVIIALAVVLPVRFFLFQPYFVQGASMEPNFHDYQYLLIDEITYRFSEPQRGDVVVLKVPFEKEALIKRIIGLPKETIDIQNGRITVYNSVNSDGLLLDEAYLSPDIITSRDQRITLSVDQYFVLGDNRPVSLDSRYFGPINRNQIVGRAWLRVWPFNTFQHFVAPIYSDSL